MSEKNYKELYEMEKAKNKPKKRKYVTMYLLGLIVPTVLAILFIETIFFLLMYLFVGGFVLIGILEVINKEAKKYYIEYAEGVLDELERDDQIRHLFKDSQEFKEFEYGILFNESNDYQFQLGSFINLEVEGKVFSHCHLRVVDNEPQMPKTVFWGSVYYFEENNCEDFDYQSKKRAKKHQSEDEYAYTEDFGFDMDEYNYEEEDDNLPTNMDVVLQLVQHFGQGCRIVKYENYMYVLVDTQQAMAYFPYADGRRVVPSDVDTLAAILRRYKKLKGIIGD